ncbi:MAG: PDZ domain-containing protein [Elusimicrobia bacterium]|nr:PDZ domain-containing protein [Elusimicrobiota bacterium]
MMRLLSLVLIAAAAFPANAASTRPASKRPARKSSPAKTAPAKAAPAKTTPAPREEAPASSPVALDEIALFGLGADLASQDGALLVSFVRPGSRAEKAGLKAGDQVLRVDGSVSTRAKTASALRSWTPGTRLPVIVRRGLEVVTLETAVVPPARDYARGDKDLSEHERTLAAERSNQAVADGRAVVKAVGPLTVAVRADQGLWVRFPKGLPAGLKKGDETAAEASTGLTVDASLDFLAVPPGSKLRARVIDAVDDGQTRTVRLAFYALDLAGGGTYTTLGHATAVSGDQRMARVAPGGTLVAAAPLPDAKRRALEPVLDADARLRVKLLEPLVIDEPPSYWRAGPGLWVKTVEDGGRRRFEVTHAIAGRSAESAGLKVGDRLDAIGGKPAEKMDFAEAVDRLYGKPESDVEVSVLRGKSQPLKLKRGMRWTGGKSTPVPLAYNAQ